MVIMAGGRGLRLHPLTENRPKPLLQVGSKPMLEELIEHFVDQDFTDIHILVCYKADMIMEYFGDGLDFGCKITYHVEIEPLGTAGGLRLIKSPDQPFIVTNADVITEIDYRDLLIKHIQFNTVATACLALYQHQIPYGVVELAHQCLVKLREKPIENFSVLAGIYVLDPFALGRIPPRGAYDMTSLLTNIANATGSVNTYQLKNHWQDIGTFQDFTGANR